MFQQATNSASQLSTTQERELSTIYSSRNFTSRLIRIWDEVQRFKQVGFIKTDDDRYFIAYRTAENELREVCEEMELLKARLAAAEGLVN
jgi:hypothetical protein